LSGELVTVRDIEVIVPLVTVFVLSTIPVSATVLDPIVSIPAVDDVPSISCTVTLTALF
jgi:hypothetical protein